MSLKKVGPLRPIFLKGTFRARTAFSGPSSRETSLKLPRPRLPRSLDFGRWMSHSSKTRSIPEQYPPHLDAEHRAKPYTLSIVWRMILYLSPPSPSLMSSTCVPHNPLRLCSEMLTRLQNPDDYISYLCAWLALLPQALCVVYVSLLWATREIEILLMFTGQMGCEVLNFAIKRLVKQERPRRMCHRREETLQWRIVD